VSVIDGTGYCRDEVLEVILDDRYENLSPVVDAMRELGPEVCDRIQVCK